MNRQSFQKKSLTGILQLFIEAISHIVSYLCFILIIIISLQVICRYLFGRGYIILEELQWHIYSISFLIGMSYCTIKNINIRMDLFYCNFSPKSKAWLEIFSFLALLLPFVVVMAIHSWDFFIHSWNIKEVSDAPMGLPYRWVIKGFLFFSFILLGLAGMTRFILAIEVLRSENTYGRD